MAPPIPIPTDTQVEQYKGEKHSAFIIGYTGETGKSLVQELNKRKIFEKVVLIGRRESQLDVGPEFEQRVIDFENTEEHKRAVQGCDVGFCCLGTTRGKAGKQGFIRVDRDYVLMNAEAAKSEGCKFYNVVSSGGANEKSMFLYVRIKGEVEETLKKMAFDRLHIAQPGLIMVDRVESRPMEAFFRAIWIPTKNSSIPVASIAEGMVNGVVSSTTGNLPIPEVNTLGNADLIDLAAAFKKKGAKK